jgi:cation diffusion facilitator CzcD-associated flavoprotein CzcO
MVSQGYHVIVVGGGFYGISAVRTYLQLNPDVSILLLDNGSTIGGVWSKSRVYPHLYANQPSPMFEFPDLSMKEALGVEDWTDLSGKDIAEYTQIYADKFGVTKHCRLNTQVLKIDRHANGSWSVFTTDTRDANKKEELRCSKLIMAMGHASNPRIPQDIDTSNYDGQVFHMKDFAVRYSAILKNPAVKNITVVGGSKSAWEAAGLFALEGKHVNWLIRDGVGPALMPRARPDGKKHMAEGKNVRALAAMAPNSTNPENWLTRFLYGGKNWFGRWFAANFWKLPLKADLKKLELGNRRLLKPLTDRYVDSGCLKGFFRVLCC